MVFSGSVGQVREKLEQETKQVLEGFPGNAIVGRGLEKLLLDRTEFDTESKTELADLREKVFFNSAAFFSAKKAFRFPGVKMEDKADLGHYQSEIANSV